MNSAAELAGFGLILGFLWFIWPPLVLLGGGLLLVTWANTRSKGGGRLGLAFGAAIAAARSAYARSRELDAVDSNVRRIA